MSWRHWRRFKTGNKLSELGASEPLVDQIEQLNKLYQQTENAPLGEATAESFIRWFLADTWTHTISPLSRLTVSDYIRKQIAAGSREQMEQEFPGHTLLQQAAAINQPSTPTPGMKTR